MATDIVLLEGVRTGFGAFGGSLKDLSATDLGVIAAKGALERGKVDAAWIDHTVFGNVVQTSPDAIYLARHIGLKAGVPIEKPALTLNRLCGSGQEAIVTGARMILSGDAEFVLTGGKIHVSTLLTGGQPVTLPLPDIHFTNLGEGPDGITAAELTRKVLGEITKETINVLTRDVANLGKGLMNGATGTLQGATEKVTKGFGDLFKKK